MKVMKTLQISLVLLHSKFHPRCLLFVAHAITAGLAVAKVSVYSVAVLDWSVS